MKKVKLLYLILVGCMISVNGQTLQDLNIDFMWCGHVYAQSPIEDTTAFRGHGVSGDKP